MKYMVNKFGLFNITDCSFLFDGVVKTGKFECLEAAVPARKDDNYYYFEAEDDLSARLIYELGGYNE